MEIGIVGLPNVGKSTLFNTLTGAQVAAECFPFTTIDPNVGVAIIDDSKLNSLAKYSGSSKITPAGIRFVDIAGLVKDAHKGEGLGNKFLSHIRSVDAIALVVRFFQDENVANSAEGIDPVKSIEIVETELLLSDLEQAQKAAEKFRKPAQTGDKKAQERIEYLDKMIAGFNQGIPARKLDEFSDLSKEFQFLTAKAVLYIANRDENQIAVELFAQLEEKAKKDQATVIDLCAKLEAEIMQLPIDERAVYYQDAGIDVPAINKLFKAGKNLLNLITFYTTNENETRSWLIQQGTPAQKAAGKIHTDMERGFIRAEVFKFEDFQKHASIKALQEKGLVTSEGKEYIIHEGDVVYFRFNV